VSSSFSKRTAWHWVIVFFACASNGDTSRNGATCGSGIDCRSGFCDVGTCASPTPANAPLGPGYTYGKACIGPPAGLIGPYGSTFGLAASCQEGYLCFDGRCSSCKSAEDCYTLTGFTSCYARIDEDRPGRRCGDSPPNGEEIYVPIDGPTRVGRRLDPVAQEDGVRPSVQLTLRSPAPSGTRIAVVWWHQRPGEFDEFLQIAYQASLPLESERAEIELADIARSYSENLICFRGCRDRAVCDCNGNPKIALGTVVLAVDADGDGTLSVEEVRTEQIGSTNLVDGTGVTIGWAPAAQIGAPRGFDGTFDPGGRIPAGFSAYSFYPIGYLAPLNSAESSFELWLCAPGDSSCSLPAPGFFCLANCNAARGLNRLGL
jgi:hypothetical protein